MEILEFIKLILEIITTFSTACVVIIHFIQFKPVKKIFTEIIPLFFCGIKSNGKKVRFFKAFKEKKLQRETTQNIIKGIAPNFEMEESLVLHPDELLKILYESNVITKTQKRKD